MELTNQTALITGGTAGIGLACARLLAREGASVIVTGRHAERGEVATTRINGSARFIQADLSDIHSVKSLVQQAGNVDILVNNAANFPAALVASKGMPGAGAYSASKAAVESLTRTWAAEFGAHGVRVNSVAPGPTKTEGADAEWGLTNEELARTLPLGRTAEHEEIAHAVLFLASPRSSFITGSTLHADGGGSAI
jgi:NAD(P)-dependent dehydrogenase (short-subunit alcohol dehydrogenase family)